MASLLHEQILMLFRNRPELAAILLGERTGIGLPERLAARLGSADLTDAVPTEYRADLVVLLGEPKVELVLVIEAQLHRDPRKRWSWPVYVTTAAARHHCEAYLLVVTPYDDVAQWAAHTINVGTNLQLRPVVIGPKGIPVVLDTDTAGRHPELAVLSAMAHGARHPEAERMGRVILQAFEDKLDPEVLPLYFDIVWISLADSVRETLLEDFMVDPELISKSPLRRAMEQAEARGEARGLALGEARSLLAVLEARNFTVGDALRQRILECTDAEQIHRWIKSATVAASLEAVFSGDPRQ